MNNLTDRWANIIWTYHRTGVVTNLTWNEMLAAGLTDAEAAELYLDSFNGMVFNPENAEDIRYVSLEATDSDLQEIFGSRIDYRPFFLFGCGMADQNAAMTGIERAWFNHICPLVWDGEIHEIAKNMLGADFDLLYGWKARRKIKSTSDFIVMVGGVPYTVELKNQASAARTLNHKPTSFPDLDVKIANLDILRVGPRQASAAIDRWLSLYPNRSDRLALSERLRAEGEQNACVLYTIGGGVCYIKDDRRESFQPDDFVVHNGMMGLMRLEYPEIILNKLHLTPLGGKPGFEIAYKNIPGRTAYFDFENAQDIQRRLEMLPLDTPQQIKDRLRKTYPSELFTSTSVREIK